MSSGIAGALEGIASDLAGAGIIASIDPAELQAPCVWVDIDAIVPELLNGNGTVRALLHLIAPNAAPVDALAALDTLLGDVLDVLDTEDDVTTESVALPDNPSQGLPALRLVTLRPYTRTE